MLNKSREWKALIIPLIHVTSIIHSVRWSCCAGISGIIPSSWQTQRRTHVPTSWNSRLFLEQHVGTSSLAYSNSSALLKHDSTCCDCVEISFDGLFRFLSDSHFHLFQIKPCCSLFHWDLLQILDQCQDARGFVTLKLNAEAVTETFGCRLNCWVVSFVNTDFSYLPWCLWALGCRWIPVNQEAPEFEGRNIIWVKNSLSSL